MRKKILIGGAIILVAGIWLLWFVGGRTANNTNGGTNGSQKIVAADADSDGLPDWEEALWKTDSKNPDTDGDGATDGAEVLASRDPKVAGPNDELTNPADRLQVLTRNALATNDEPILEPPAEVIAARIANPLGPLTIINLEASSTAQVYGLAFVAAIKPYLESQTEYMPKVLLRYTNEGNEADISTLVVATVGSAKALENLRSVAIPKSIAEAHTRFVEHLAKVNELLVGMSLIKTEPLLALQSGQQYMLEYAQATKALLEINQYFIDHRVIFDAKTTPKIKVNL